MNRNHISSYHAVKHARDWWQTKENILNENIQMCLLDNDVSKSFCKEQRYYHGHWRKWACKKEERIWVTQIAEKLLEWRPFSPVKALARSSTAFFLQVLVSLSSRLFIMWDFFRRAIGSETLFTCFCSFSVGLTFSFLGKDFSTPNSWLMTYICLLSLFRTSNFALSLPLCAYCRPFSITSLLSDAQNEFFFLR